MSVICLIAIDVDVVIFKLIGEVVFVFGVFLIISRRRDETSELIGVIDDLIFEIDIVFIGIA